MNIKRIYKIEEHFVTQVAVSLKRETLRDLYLPQLSSGTYYYKTTVDGKGLNTGKLIKY